MKNVLIVCDAFPPQWGPRMGYLAKYLGAYGWRSFVVAADNPSRNDQVGLDRFPAEIVRVPQKKHGKWNLLHLLPLICPYDYLRGEYDLRNAAEKIVQGGKIDLILCSHTFGFFPLSTAYYVARKYRLPLVVDIRDLAAQSKGRPFFKQTLQGKIDTLIDRLSFLNRIRVRAIYRKTRALTTISTWHTEYLKACNNQTVCIYNGFDPELFRPLPPVKNPRFEIVYTGTLGSKELRNYEFLLQAVRRLHEEGMIAPESFHVSFYCGRIMEGNPIRRQIHELGIEDYFSFLSFLPSAELPRMFQRASALLVLTNKATSGDVHGIMTTKFFEYLAVNRPILCVTSDEECLEKAIRETDSGCAARTVEETVSFLSRLLKEWKEKGVTAGTTKPDALAPYSREYQAGQFAKLFDSILANKEK